jgi:hypothetical protein
MAKYQVVKGFTVLGKEYPATIDGSEIDHLDSLVQSGRIVPVAEKSTSNATTAGDKLSWQS